MDDINSKFNYCKKENVENNKTDRQPKLVYLSPFKRANLLRLDSVVD